MKLYIKYSKEPPYLPEAVADSKTELAKMLGLTPNNVMSSYSKGRGTYQVVEVEEDEYKNTGEKSQE